MRHRLGFSSLVFLALFFALVPTALASSRWYVDGMNGSDKNNCKSPQTACKTIGHTISLASSGDSIRVAPATYRENLTVTFSLNLIGSGANTTIVDGGGIGTVVIISSAAANVALSHVTIRNGLAPSGGGINNSGTLVLNNNKISRNTANQYFAGQGGGIYNNGTLTINKSTISGNTAAASSSGIAGQGAGINNARTLVINKSTISGNTATGGYDGGVGGGMFNYFGTVTINDSTISGNSATDGTSRAYGGGIFTVGGRLTISNSTIGANTAYYGGGICQDPHGGTAALQDSILANSFSGGNCSGTVTSNGYNLSSDSTCNFNSTGDLNNTDPKLGKLGNYGGPTQTIPLLSGGPAIDAGNPNGCSDGNGHLLKTDQRGYPRPDKEDTGGCDMGAYERQKD
jgi:hypothetical protein